MGWDIIIFYLFSAVLGDMSFEKSGIYENVFLDEEPEALYILNCKKLILNFFMKKCSNREYTGYYDFCSPTMDFQNWN